LDINVRLQQIAELIGQAKAMPLSSSVLVNREEIMDLLESAQAELPEEIKQARWVVKDREELITKARRDGEAVMQKAAAEQARLLSEEEVVRAAQAEAEAILGEAREQARQLRLEAEDYVDAKLAQYEIALEKTWKELQKSIAQVRRGRDKLRGVSPAEQEFGEPEEEEEEARR
jgi:hypothetical protein